MNSYAIRNLSMGGALLLIALFFTLADSKFISPQNLSNLSIELAITATLALGMLLVLLPGMIDLSVGSGVGMLGAVAAVLVCRPDYLLGAGAPNFPAWAALGVAFVLALAIWGLMGTLIIRQKVPAFIITLGGLLIFKGVHWLVIHNATVPVVPGGSENLYSYLASFYFSEQAGYLIFAIIAVAITLSAWRNRAARIRLGFKAEDVETVFLKIFVTLQGLGLVVIVMNLHKGLPLSLLLLCAVASIVQLVTRHMPLGRNLYAIGGNEEAARLSGIPIHKTIISAYVLLGAIVALTGFMQTAYGGYTTTTVGQLMELDAIAACVIGGTSLRGGRGTVLGVLFGALIMATLLNGMTLLAVSPELKTIARGSVLVLAVWMDVALSRKSSVLKPSQLSANSSAESQTAAISERLRSPAIR